MAWRPLCGLCRKHRPGSLRKCVKCQRKVGPGCYPEKCLHQEYNNKSGLCKECHRVGRIELLTKSTPDYLDILTVAGF